VNTLAWTGRDRAFRDDVRVEFARLFRAPRAELTSLAANAIAVTAAWTLLPASVHDWLFRLTGPLAFAVVLQAWMLGDTATTNVLGNDVDAALGALEDQPRLTRLLRAKAVALAVVAAIPCAVVALVIAGVDGAYGAGALVAVVVLAAPFGAAAVATLIGVSYPYHPRPLRWRWEQRHAYRRTLRWLALIVTPFLFVPTVMAVLIAAGIAIGDATGGRDAQGHLEVGALAIATAALGVLSFAALWLAPQVSAAIAGRRAANLRGILQHPDEW
jgi:hypothetical protein